jgi:lysophospholipid acyltransferase
VQIRRIYIAYGQNGVDITGIFMMQLFVWVGMGYNYQNGGADLATLTHDQKRRMIKDMPNYITYIGYVNFLPACLIGPVYEYRDYEDYLNRVQDYVHIPSPLWAMAK